MSVTLEIKTVIASINEQTYTLTLNNRIRNIMEQGVW